MTDIDEKQFDRICIKFFRWFGIDNELEGKRIKLNEFWQFLLSFIFCNDLNLLPILVNCVRQLVRVILEILNIVVHFNLLDKLRWVLILSSRFSYKQSDYDTIREKRIQISSYIQLKDAEIFWIWRGYSDLSLIALNWSKMLTLRNYWRLPYSQIVVKSFKLASRWCQLECWKNVN